MAGSIKDQDHVHYIQRLVVPASIFVKPDSVDGCDFYPEEVTNGIDYYVFSPGGTLQEKLQVLFV